jgi:hypothetical protein
MPESSSHVNMHNSYSSTDMSRWSNHNAYIFEHVSNIHNVFVPPYSSTELATYCTPQTHMPMSNCYSRVDMRASADFSQSLYTAPDSIGMEIASNMVSSPPVASSTFHSASLVVSTLQTGYPRVHASTQRQTTRHVPTHYHIPSRLWNPPPCLGRAPVLPRVPTLWTPPLYLGGLRRSHVY